MSDSANSAAMVLNVVKTAADEPPEPSLPNPAIATILGRSPRGVLVEVSGQQFEARIAVAEPLENAVGQEVVVTFIDGDSNQAIVIGLLREPRPATPDERDDAIEIDAARLGLVAQRELVLRCGKASIRLTRDGRVVIDGVQIVSRAEGANRIRGGSIHLN